jgi:O-antigen/teichoic acid export membrane protein
MLKPPRLPLNNYFQNFWKRFVSSSYMKDSAKLTLGSGIGQLILFATSPLLSRYYSPSDFGTLAIFTAWQALLTLLMTGKFEQAIILENDNRQAWTLCQLVACFASVAGLIVLPVLWIFKKKIAIYLGCPAMENWLPWMPLFSMISGLALAGYYWALRLQRFDRAGIYEIILRLTQVGTSIAFGISRILSGGLIIALGTSQAIKAAMSLSLRPPTWKTNTKERLAPRLIGSFQRHWRLCFSMIGSQGLSVGANYVLIFALGALYGDSRLGLYSMANRMVGIPTMVIANAIGDVYRQRAAESYRALGSFDDVMLSTLKKTLALSIIPYSILFLLSPWLFAVVFGEEWREAGQYARILVVSGFFSFISTPVDKASVIVGAKTYILCWHTIRFTFIFFCFAAAWYLKFEIHVVLWVITSIQIALYMADLWYGWKMAKGLWGLKSTINRGV